VPFGAEDVQPALSCYAVPEHNVGPASRHVGRDGDRSRLPRHGHDFGFLFVMLGVEHLVAHSFTLQGLAQPLRILDAHRAHQHRPSQLVQLLDFLHRRPKFFFLGPVNAIWVVGANHFAVSRDHHHIQFVDLGKFCRFRVRRPGHPRQLIVHPEVVLEGNGSQGLVFVLDLDTFLGFQRLMQPFAVAAPGHDPPGEFIHDDHLAVLDDVVHITLEESMRPQGLLHVMEDIDVAGIIEVFHAQQVLRPCHPLFG